MQISVIVPVRNEEDSITELLDGLLSQSRLPEEIVITDGGSTDTTVSIIKNYIRRGAPVQLIESGPALPGRGRNLAARKASFEWLAFIDAGVKPDQRWLQSLADRVGREEGIEVVYGAYEPIINSVFEECAALAYVPPPVEKGDSLIRSGSIVSALMKQAVWEEVGGFPEHLRSAEDLLFMNKVAAAGKRTAYAPDAVVHWRLQSTFWKTFKKFISYARSNIQAGLWNQWQAAIFRRYLLLAITALPAFVFGWRWLFVTAGLWLLMLIARGIVAIRRNRHNFPAGVGRNSLRLLLLVPLILILDAAAVLGSIQWLVQDKLRLKNAASGVGNGV